MITVRLNEFSGNVLRNLDRLSNSSPLCYEPRQRLTRCQVLPVFQVLNMQPQSVFFCHSPNYTP